MPQGQTQSPGLSTEVPHKGAYPRRTPDGSNGQDGLSTDRQCGAGDGDGRSHSGRWGFCTKQQVRSTPSLSSYNHFEVLTNICDFETNLADVQKSEQAPNPPPISIPVPASSLRMQKLKWEKALPKSYIVAAMEEKPTSLKLKVEFETMDTAEKKSVTALLDSGATGECICKGDCRDGLKQDLAGGPKLIYYIK